MDRIVGLENVRSEIAMMRTPDGHGVSEGGFVLDLRNMRAPQIDPECRTTWAESKQSLVFLAPPY